MRLVDCAMQQRRQGLWRQLQQCRIHPFTICHHMQAALTTAKEQAKSSAEQVCTASSGVSASTRAQHLEAEVSRLQQTLALKGKAVAYAEQQVLCLHVLPLSAATRLLHVLAFCGHVQSFQQDACMFLHMQTPERDCCAGALTTGLCLTVRCSNEHIGV